MRNWRVRSGRIAPASVFEPRLLDGLMASWREVLGEDYEAYRNHCRRVFNFCFALSGSRPEQEEKIAVAAVFHDLGIWSAATFDYLAPSQELARDYLESLGKTEWQEEIAAMIGEHHKLTPVKRNPLWLAEPFRRADLIDISIGLIKFRLPDDFVAEVLDAYPNAGFHKKLLALSFERFMSHPFNPLPMVKL
ncbi:metal dependent phosphohydrolase [Chlorobium limicola DSM 245]|uniref:Metal dependent phosphohydrolase n=1 Tax=Chlorobium limicola (strain DSM 245 / NBRC 103803 / 6330) TaxID=290315 RepID=B3EG13_CHLL2|nr:HD domain-containing protein [Chlorobium limicola]ACD89546.1 metal dependent phosphohydrolase [Chlorobium limicola DSM 245]